MVDEISSNTTGLLIAEETTPRTLPANPVWYREEPNDYSDFGADISTVARQPISQGRQQRKGTVTDLDAAGSFSTDFTRTKDRRKLRGYFCAEWYEKPTTQPVADTAIPLTSVLSGTKRFGAAAGLGVFFVGSLVLAEGFGVTTNNGLKTVAAIDAAYVEVSEALSDEANPPAAAKLSTVGFKFGTGAASLDVTGGRVALNIGTGLVAADGTFTLTNNVAGDETVTIGSRTYTFKAAPADANEVDIGVDASGSLDNLIAAINGGAGSGTAYGAGTVPHADVTAAAGTGDTMDVTAKVAGTVGNAIATTTTAADGTWGNTHLESGTGISPITMGIKVGEWHFIGGDDASNCFASFLAGGYARVSAVNSASIVYDKVTWSNPADDAGAGKDITLFFGDFIKNEKDADKQVFPTYHIERTLGNDGDGVQSEILIGASFNELGLNFDTADKLTMDVDIVALDTDHRTGVQGPLSEAAGATIVDSPNEEAINTSSNIYRVRMNVIDDATLTPTPMFAYVEEASLGINNNYEARKALGVLGGFKTSPGNFEVSGDLTAYFTNVAALAAIRNNASVTMDYIVSYANTGYVLDIPLLTLGGGQLDIALNESIKVPLDTTAFEGANGYTLGFTYFPYLPTAGMATT